MSSKLIRAIEKYAQYHPTSLSMQNFIEFGAQAGKGEGKLHHSISCVLLAEVDVCQHLRRE